MGALSSHSSLGALPTLYADIRFGDWYCVMSVTQIFFANSCPQKLKEFGLT